MPLKGDKPNKPNVFQRLSGIFRQKKHGSARRATGDLAMNQVLQAQGTSKIPSWKQLRELPRLLSRTEKRIASFALLLFVVAGVALGIRLINSTREAIPRIGGEYTEGLIGSPQLINPLYASTSDVDSDLSRLIFSGLMKFTAEDGLTTDLASAYSISEDQKEYTFILRDNAVWHDGNPVRVDDIIFTISAIQNMEYRSPLEVSFSGVKVDQIDDRTVKFTLDEPFAPFLSLLTVGILPSHIWQDVQPINAPAAIYNREPIGSGPYRVEKIARDGLGNIRSYTLKRHRNYHGGEVYIDRIIFKFYPEITSAVEALRNQNVQGLAYLPPNEVERFERVNAVSIALPRLQQYTALFLNEDGNDILEDIEVRQALAHGTNKQLLIDNALSGLGESIDSFILPGMIGEHENIQTYAFDQEQARTLLEEAGWVLEDGSTVRTNGDAALTLTLTTLNTEELVQIAELLQSQWAEIGIDLQIETVLSAQFQNDTIGRKEYDILLSGELYGVDPDPYVFWHSSQISGQGLNLAKFANRDADELIETGRSTSDETERAQAYQELQDIVAENVPAIFLYQPVFPYPQAKQIKGANLNRIVSPSDRFNNIDEWFIKTRRILDRK